MTLTEEANRVARRLVGRPPSPEEAERYARAHQALDLRLDAYEAGLLRLALANGLLWGAIDGGLALTRPEAPLRRKFFVMLAIMEASPRGSGWFLREESGWADFALLGLRAAWAGVKGLAGCVFLAAYRAWWRLSGGDRRQGQ